jgi:hypothetical protein
MNSIQLANSAKLNHMKTAIQSYSPTKLKFYFPANCLHTHNWNSYVQGKEIDPSITVTEQKANVIYKYLQL